MNLGRLVTKAAKKYGNRKAIRFDGKDYSCLEVNERVNRLANGLMNLGVKCLFQLIFLFLSVY